MKKRYLTAKDTPREKDSVGNNLCRWCKGIVPKPKRTWCSDVCVNEYRLRSDREYAREQVFFRDAGICAKCGLDTTALKRAFVRALYEASGKYHTTPHPAYATKQEAVIKRLEALGFSAKRNTFWDLDHKQRVADGGGACGMDNLTSLCVICHKTKTAKENKKKG